MATNYFTKWVETRLFANVTQVDVIKFIKPQIIYRFEDPETNTMDQGTMFTREKMKTFSQQFGF